MAIIFSPLTKEQAHLIAADYRGEVGKPFNPDFEGFIIKDIVCQEMNDGSWQVFTRALHDRYNVYITEYLHTYLNRNGLEFNPERYGLNPMPRD